MSLVVVTLVIHSFSWLLQIDRQLATQRSGLSSSMEWHLFSSNLDNTSQNWRFLKVENGRVWFKEATGREDYQLFFIDQVNSQLRKRKNNGVELLLDHVESVSYYPSEIDFRMEVTFTDGKKYQGSFPQWVAK